MNFSFISTHDGSRKVFNVNSVFNQSIEENSYHNEYSTLVEYNTSSTINSIYDGFKNTTKHYSENSNYLSMVKEFPNSLYDYLELIEKNLNMLSKQIDNELSTIAFLIHNEIKTWKLIGSLYEDRFANKSSSEENRVLNGDAIYSELEVLRKVFESNKELREAQIVIDWLELFLKEKIENNPEFLIGSHGKSWEHTKYLLKKHEMFRSTGLMNKAKSHLDPDAPLRGDLNLTDKDKSDENEYFRYLFHCVQSGDYEKAQSVCQNHEELWRAQSLEGWKPFHNPLLRDSFFSDNGPIDIIGNPNRKLFKFVCQKLSENTELNVYERAIYAIFAGNLPVLAMVESDWNGLLWAHFKVYIEVMVDRWLEARTNNGVLHTQSLFGNSVGDLDLGQLGLSSMLGNDAAGSAACDAEEMSVEKIFGQISAKLIQDPLKIVHRSLGGVGVLEQNKRGKPYYQSVFQIVQQYVILDDILGLIEQIDYIVSHLPKVKSVCDRNMIRFIAHLVIFIYSTHENLPIDIYHKSLEALVSSLLDEKRLENVAFYISRLSTDLQIKWYCQCLSGVTNYLERRRCVQDGLEYDLPVVEVTRLLVRAARVSAGFGLNSTMQLTPPDELTLIATLTDTPDDSRIEALDWLTFLPEQQCHLLRQANALSRLFLLQDKLYAAKMALSKVNDDVWSCLNIRASNGPSWLPCALYEYQCLRSYIECHDLFGNWYNHFTRQKPSEIDLENDVDLNKLSFQEKQLLQKKRDEYTSCIQQWEKLNDFHGNKALECVCAVLKMGRRGWMSELGEDSVWQDEENDSCDRSEEWDGDKWDTRRQQIEQLRKRCIVMITFMSIKMMMNINKSEKCFSIIDIIADDTYQLFRVFEKNQLQKLLARVRDCSLQQMSTGRDAFGIEY